ncbi:MAG TPA: RNA polymerase sigma factor [Polyangiaceae bacterium]|nr:RNA polymerase sigma factor [Polyangiaceae bacterium]
MTNRSPAKAVLAEVDAPEMSSPRPRTRRVDLNPHDVAEQGARFVPQTLRYLGVSRDVLSDAVQDVFLIALRRLGDFEGRSSLRTWLYGICVNVAHEHRRRARKATYESLTEESPDVVAAASQENELERAEWRRSLNALLDELDENQRAVFVLYEIEELNMREVADALACPLQTAYFRYKSAKQRVLKAFRRSEARCKA